MITDLNEIVERLLADAAAHPRGRAAHLVIGGDRLRVTAMALRAGEALGEHDSPPAATIQVLRGQAKLHGGEDTLELSQGQLAPIPDARHDLEAVTDCVVLLTVSLVV